MQIFSLRPKSLQRDIDGRIRCFFSPRSGEGPTTRHVVKGSCVNIRDGREITRRFRPSGGAYQTRRCVGLQKKYKRSKKFPESANPHLILTKKKNPAIFETIPPSVIAVAFGEGEQIASPAFRLKSKRRFTKQKAKRFLRVSAGSPKRNICLGEAIPLIKGG